jgi:chromosome segregation ATPase
MVAVEDASKRFNEVATRSKEMTAMYEVIKTEKNKYVNLIQSMKQRTLEMQDKIKILGNEIEILRTERQAKEKDLGKKRLEYSTSMTQRDTLRQDSNKFLLEYRELRDKVEQNICSIETLQANIENQEQVLSGMNDRFESALTARNTNASQLIERNDELCLLYERYNLHDQILKKAEFEMQNRESEISHLKVQRAALQREIEIIRRSINSNNSPPDEMVTLQRELEQLQEISSYLGCKVENPFFEDASIPSNLYGSNKHIAEDLRRLIQTKRRHDLPGKDPSLPALEKRAEELNRKLTTKEEMLLEKELILNEVNSLLHRLECQVRTARKEAAEANTQLNDLSKRIKTVTTQMMSKISELSMIQAQVLKLAEEKKMKEELIGTVMKSNDGSSTEWEKEWQAQQRIKELKLKEQKRQEIELAHAIGTMGIDPSMVAVPPEAGVSDLIFYMLPTGIRTTAAPRPNAYLPSTQTNADDPDSKIPLELPIPKPYGQFAPTKPSNKSVMLLKSTRRPTEKEIEI